MKNEKRTQVNRSTFNVSYRALKTYKDLKLIDREEGLDVGMFYMLFELNKLRYRTRYSCSGHNDPEYFYISMYMIAHYDFEKDNTGQFKPISTKEDIIPIEKLNKPISLIYLEKAAEGLFKIEKELCFSHHHYIDNESLGIISLNEQDIDIFLKHGLISDMKDESLTQEPIINVCIRVLDEMKDSTNFDKIVENFNEMIRRLKKMWNVI